MQDESDSHKTATGPSKQKPSKCKINFIDLRLSTQQFNEYKCDNPDMLRYPIERPCFHYRVQVRGYKEEAARAISAANAHVGGRDFFEIKCWAPDSTRWIKQRIEHRLRIPEKYWALAADGLMLPPGRLAYMSFAANKKLVELLLVPAPLLREYESHKRHIWNALPFPVPKQRGLLFCLGPDKKYIYKIATPLNELLDSKLWFPYLEQRRLAGVHLQKMLDEYAARPLNPLLEQIRRGRYLAVTHPLREHLTSGVLPLKWEINRFLQPIDAQVVTRIYSPTKPAAVDVYWQYHYHNRSREEEVSFHCALLWRAHDPVTGTGIVAPKLDLRDTRRAPRAGHGGWQRVFELNMNAPPDVLWREVNERTWGLRKEDVARVHALLFGFHADSDLGARTGEVSRVDTVQLLMAAVGFLFSVATRERERGPDAREDDGKDEDEDEDEDSVVRPYELGERDEQDPLGIAVTKWDFDECAGWLGAHVRWACGMRLARDEQYLRDMPAAVKHGC